MRRAASAGRKHIIWDLVAQAEMLTRILARYGMPGALFLGVFSCAPQPTYRPPPPAQRQPPAAPAPVPPGAAKQNLPPDSKIREQDIRPTPAPPTTGRSPGASETRSGVESAPSQSPPLPDDSSLLAKITPSTPPQRAASLRLTEDGRKILDAGDPGKALARLEKTIVIDSTNPYGYFYLAKAQHRMGRFRESLNFLDIAESRLGNEPFWLAEIHALRGDNYRALGQLQRAEASYNQALRLNSGNRAAAEGLTRPAIDAPAAQTQPK